MFYFSSLYDLTEENNIKELINLYNIDTEDLDPIEIQILIIQSFVEKLVKKIKKNNNLSFALKDWFESEVSDLMDIEYEEDEEVFIFNCCLDEIFDEDIEDIDDLIKHIVYFYENI